MRPLAHPTLVFGAGALGLIVLAAAASPSARRAVQNAEQKVEHLITDWIPALIARTSAHEGHYWSVQRNLDGNGVSYGILQWTQKSGSLGNLLRAMAAADPAAFVRFFGPWWSRVLEVTGRASLEAVDGAVLWSEPWVSRFVAAGRWPALQVAQVQLAGASEYMAAAVDVGRILGVATERAMAVYFDRAVQQGATAAHKPAERLEAWYAGSTPPTVGAERRRRAVRLDVRFALPSDLGARAPQLQPGGQHLVGRRPDRALRAGRRALPGRAGARQRRVARADRAERQAVEFVRPHRRAGEWDSR